MRSDALPLLGEPAAERADAQRNRLKILDAAERLFAANGIANVSMDAVAKAAGVGKGTLFRRFGDRAGLAVALLGERGSFLVTTHTCQQRLCITGGTFTSDDKRVVARDLLGIYRWKLGTRHRVVYNADTSDVIPLPAHWDPTAAALGVAGATTLIGLWTWCLRGAIRRARPRLVRPGPASR